MGRALWATINHTDTIPPKHALAFTLSAWQLIYTRKSWLVVGNHEKQENEG